jgi:hypothetical protein
MSDHTLNDIMCLALVDGKFRHTLLTDVADVVEGFDLDPEERDILRAIQADSVTDFAGELHAWMLQRHRGNGHRMRAEPKQLRSVWNKGVSLWYPVD